VPLREVVDLIATQRLVSLPIPAQSRGSRPRPATKTRRMPLRPPRVTSSSASNGRAARAPCPGSCAAPRASPSSGIESAGQARHASC
jgi:hypothetical protein